MGGSWWKWALGVFGVLVVVSILVDDPDQDATAEVKREPKVVLEVASPPAVVAAKTVEISGTVVPARAVVEIEVDGATPEVAMVDADGAFSFVADMNELGENAITTSAGLGSRRAVSVQMVVERKLSPAERAAKRERIRKRRAAAERRRAARIAREERRAARRAARLAAEQERKEQEQEALEEEEASAGCDPNYSGCVPVASDVDCAGGSGDGPEYTGEVTVLGDDPYDLDSDGDGVACESY